MKIGVFDSGMGGTTILEAVKKRLPEAEYRYIADSENCPYGEKSNSLLYEIVRGQVEVLRDWGADVIVIACNTATVRCIDKLRRDYPELKFVGTEPAVKLALKTGARKVLVLATPNTVKSERMKMLAEKNHGDNQKVDLLACPGLARIIEDNYRADDKPIIWKLHELLTVDESYEAVVLGCTHYSLVKDLIQKFYPKAELIDGADGVARRVEELVIKM
ncbi:glutamate racemase [Candidatus Saccharibacteria bacterium]|nr:glutamate racemase [Candidatus Saccharibacteria bacterium]